MDEEGYFYFVSRRDDIIKTRGEKVSPKEIEEVLHTVEGVAEAAVVAIPDEVLGQAIKAVVTLSEGVQLTKQEILRHCAKHLEDFKIPQQVEFRAALPKTPNGKIDRKELRSPVETQA
jgi:acyl-coenzyme A synthetase/AMP-(fatty) acid ligase